MRTRVPESGHRCPDCGELVRCPLETESRLIFVYGTLKRGRHNNRFLTKSRFVAEAKLAPNYALFGSGVPILCPTTEGAGLEVEGEVWEVTPCQLHGVDRLEGHPGNYTRIAVPLSEPLVLGDRTVLRVEAYAYLHSDWRAINQAPYARYPQTPDEELSQRRVEAVAVQVPVTWHNDLIGETWHFEEDDVEDDLLLDKI